MSDDTELLRFIIKAIVAYPDKVWIDRTTDERGVLLTVEVNPADLGRVIGKRGATAQAIRTLLRALGAKTNARYNLRIVDNGRETE